MFANYENKNYTGPKVVVYGGTRNIYDKMLRSAKSLIYHTDVDKVYFLIEDDKIDCPEPLPDNFEFINVSDQQYFPTFGPNYNTRSTYMSLMRLALFRMLPEYDRVLWIDDDTYIMADISELFNVPLEDKYYMAMCEEVESYSQSMQILRTRGIYIWRTYPKYTEYPYYNDGVAVFNLNKLRDGMGDTLIDAINEYHFGCADQDVINEYCHDYVYTISSEYNAAYFTKPPRHAKIYHYSGLDDEEKTKDLNERYTNLSFSDIVAWRKARKEYINCDKN